MDSQRISTSEFAISSLECLSEQISNFVFSKRKVARLASINLTDEDQDTLRASFLQMRALLVEAQTHFTKMTDNNCRLAAKIDGSLHDTNEEMMAMKVELQRLVQMVKQPPVSQEKTECCHLALMDLEELKRENLRLVEELEKARLELQKAVQLNQQLTNNNEITTDQNQLKQEVIKAKRELIHCQEQINTMKADQKRLRAEKLDLLGQMKHLYGTLENKEVELKQFISNYEQRITESENIIKQMASERTDHQRLKWDLAQRANAMTEHSVALKLELDIKDQVIAQLEHELGLQRQVPVDQSASPSEDSLRSKAFTEEQASSNNLSTTPDDSYSQTFPRSSARAEHQKNRKVSWSRLKGDPNSSCLSDEEKTGILTQAKRIVPVRWKADHVRAWLELDVQMSGYGPACTENIKSGRILLGLNDSELDSSLGLQSPVHRRKLRLAIEELRHPETKIYPMVSSLTHLWVASEWLPSLGLPQFSSTFEAQLVDGRLLANLTKKDLEKHLSVLRKLHQTSIMCGIDLLRSLEFEKRVLTERRSRTKDTNNDPIVWSNEQVINWVKSIDLEEYADNLKNSGIHGALLVSEQNFTVESLGVELGIPSTKSPVMRHLATELKTLITNAKTSQSASNPPKKSNIARSPFIRSFRRPSHEGKGKGATDDPTRQSKGSEKSFNWRGSIGRAFGKKLHKEQIRIVHSEMNAAKSLSNIDESTRYETTSSDGKVDRLI